MLTDALSLQQASLYLESTNKKEKENQKWFQFTQRLEETGGAGSLFQRPPVIPIPFNFTVHHLSQSLPGPRPSRGSLTDGLEEVELSLGAGTLGRWDAALEQSAWTSVRPDREDLRRVTAR